MSLVGIAAGVISFAAANTVVDAVLHSNTAGIVPGMVAGLWAGWPLFHKHRAKRDVFLHPAPLRYPVNVQRTFDKIREILRETTYQYGDRWHVLTAEISTLRIVADLHYVEEIKHLEIQHQTIREHVERIRRYIKMEIQMKAAGSKSIVQYDFTPRIEGLNSSACDEMVRSVLSAVEGKLGTGEPVAEIEPKPLSSPPLWLITSTGIMLVLLAKDAWQAVVQ